VVGQGVLFPVATSPCLCAVHHATARCNASMKMIVPVALHVTVKLYCLHSFQGSYIYHFVNIFGHLCNLFLDLLYACYDTSYTDSDIDIFSAAVSE